MSTPTEPTEPDRLEPNTASEPGAVPTAPDVPATPYPADAAPTQAYPPAPPAAPYGQAPYGQAPYGQAPYGQPAYGQPAYAAAPAGPDTRPKTLAWWSVGLVVAGIVLVLIGFLPIPWVGFISVLVGGLALLVAFVLSIVVLANRKQGGKPLGIVALVVSVLGGGLWAVALFVSLAFGIVSTAGETGSAPDPQSSVAPDETDGSEADDPDASGSYDREAFLTQVGPALLEVFRDLDPTVTEEFVTQVFPDDSLVALGESLILAGDAGRDQMIDTLVQSSQGAFGDDTAADFIDAIIDAAEDHLQR